MLLLKKLIIFLIFVYSSKTSYDKKTEGLVFSYLHIRTSKRIFLKPFEIPQHPRRIRTMTDRKFGGIFSQHEFLLSVVVNILQILVCQISKESAIRPSIF